MRFAVLLALVTAGAVAHAQAPAEAWSVDPRSSTVTYELVHKLHKFSGTSKKVEGKARLTAGGTAQVMLRVPVESFDSGNVNRDEHMKETVEAVRFPEVELKALGEGVTLPSTFPGKLKQSWKAQLKFHGVQQLFDLPIEIEFVSANEAHARATFDISLEEYKVERPSLMFVKIENNLRITATITFKR